jgi:hypothetical protein
MLIVRGGVWLGLCRGVGVFYGLDFFFLGWGARMGWMGYRFLGWGFAKSRGFFVVWESYVLVWVCI